MIGRIAAVLAFLAMLAGIGSATAAGTTIPAAVCDPIAYICV